MGTKWESPFEKVREVVRGMLLADVMEDRCEYSQEMLERAYGPGTPADIPQIYIADLHCLIRAWSRFYGSDEEFAEHFLTRPVPPPSGDAEVEMSGCRAAIEWALGQAPIGSPQHETLSAILAQRGCGDYDPILADDGTLTGLMDLVIYG